jgi:spore germination protein GerM
MTRPRTTRIVGGLALGLALTIAASACGLPQDHEPQKIAGALPENLRIRDNTSTTDPRRSAQQIVYFVRAGNGADAPDTLVRVPVNVNTPDNAADLPMAILNELFKGTTADERDKNVSSDLPDNIQINNLSQSGDTITVDLNNLQNVVGPRQRLAVAQIVFTLTELPDVQQVAFLLNGLAQPIPIENGSSDPGQAIGRSSFPTLDASIIASNGTDGAAGQSDDPPPSTGTTVAGN